MSSTLNLMVSALMTFVELLHRDTSSFNVACCDDAHATQHLSKNAIAHVFATCLSITANMTAPSRGYALLASGIAICGTWPK